MTQDVAKIAELANTLEEQHCFFLQAYWLNAVDWVMLAQELIFRILLNWSEAPTSECCHGSVGD
jgi:hypothetical protein